MTSYQLNLEMLSVGPDSRVAGITLIRQPFSPLFIH